VLVESRAVPGSTASAPLVSAELAALGDELWRWRAVAQPISGDDIPRIERPAGWIPRWSASDVAAQRSQLDAFRARHAALAAPSTAWSIDQQVD
jgi:hypothetical protein